MTEHNLDNFALAGKRLHDDASVLFGRQRYGTASHLFGLSAECSIKAFMVQQPGQQNAPRKHIPELLDDAKRLLSGRSRSHLLNLISSPDYMAGWEIGNRYWSDAQFNHDQCKKLKVDSEKALRCQQPI